MALTLQQEVEVAALTAIKAAFDANPAVVDGIIAQAENGLLGIVTTGLKALSQQKVGGIFGGVLPGLEGALDAAIEAQANALISKFGPAVVAAFIDRELGLAIAAAQK